MTFTKIDRSKIVTEWRPLHSGTHTPHNTAILGRACVSALRDPRVPASALRLAAQSISTLKAAKRLVALGPGFAATLLPEVTPQRKSAESVALSQSCQLSKTSPR